MVPVADVAALAFSVMAMLARFGRLMMSLMSQVFGKNLIGSLRNGHVKARPPQALDSSK